jgi:AcrR family transcriptional regulator
LYKKVKRRKEDADQTRDALLKAALTVFSTRGYTVSTLSDIAMAANVTRGALYHHFSGKAELFNTLLQQAINQPAQIVQVALAEGGTFLEIIHRVFVQQIVAVQTDPVYRATVELVMFKLESNPELEEAKLLLSNGRQASLELLEQSFEGAQRSGVVRKNLKPLEFAKFFLSLQIGLFHLWSSHPGDFDLERSANAAAEVMIAGIQT